MLHPMISPFRPRNDIDLRSRSLARPLVASLLLAALLGGCGTDRIVSNAAREPSDIRDRHPIVLADRSRTLDVFVGTNASTLDPRQQEDLRAFVKEFREHGKGAMTAFVPVGSTDPAGDARGIEMIRTALGGPRGHFPLSVQTYAVEDPSLAAPIRLSFAELGAKVPHSCGRWPKDLSGSNTREGIENEQYWNFGCAQQQNLAAMVADPIDLVRPQTEGRIDIVKRSNEIEKLRKGEDPATNYDDTKNKAVISNVGSN
jgi:pilus assembly protein CpaD